MPLPLMRSPVTTRCGDDRIIAAIDDDGALYPVEKLDAHRRGIKHLAISAFVFSGNRLLVQRRAGGKYHSPGQWANTCCTHPDWQEDPSDCATRRLWEELGLEIDLEPRAVIEYMADVGQGLTEHERVHVFEGTVEDPDAVIPFDPTEVDKVRWVEIAELQHEARLNPETITPWFRIYLQRWAELGLSPA
jgi:isopentenyl-diphosphate Delta-isomerase